MYIEIDSVKHDFDDAPYIQPLMSWLHCVNFFFADKVNELDLKTQLNRRDINSVCGVELYELKKAIIKKD